MNPKPSKPLKRFDAPASLCVQYGFSLVELLVALAIVAILAVILLPILGTVRKASHNATCVSNMRQIGTGILLYAGDNEQRLPGSLFPTQGPVYNLDQRRLPNRLVPYLDIPKSDTWSTSLPVMTRAEIFACPEWHAAATAEDIYSLQVNMWMPLPDGGTLNPWGSGDSKGIGDVKDMNPPPMTFQQIYARGIDPSNTWIIIESDLKRAHTSSTRLLDEPIHESYRNAVYMDGHVGALDLNDNPI